MIDPDLPTARPRLVTALTMFALSQLIVLTAAAAPSAGKPVTLQLEKSVLLMRHGVRAPTQSPEELAQSSRRPWPQWPVAKGELTERGAALVTVLGRYHRQHLAAAGLLPAEGCPAAGSIGVWADNSAKRIALSGQALLDGLAPGCDFKPYFAPPPGVDPLFQPVETGTCPIDHDKARAAILDAAGGSLGAAAASVRPALLKMQGILDVRSNVGCEVGVSSCGIDGFANRLETGPEGVRLEGGLKAATTVGENFLLEYLQGFADKDVAWGDAATPETLAPLLAPRNLYLKLTRRPAYIASRNGTTLAKTVLAILEAEAANPPAAADTPLRANQWVAIIGRDIHLATLGGVLGLDWTLPGQPDAHAPGVALRFERLRHPNGQRYIRTSVVYQTLTQLRAEAALDLAHPPATVVLHIPGCAQDEIDGACPLPKVHARFLEGFAPDCPQAARPRAVSLRRERGLPDVAPPLGTRMTP